MKTTEKLKKYEKLLIKYENMSDLKKLEVMEDAIYHMQQNKNLSVDECKILAMGGTTKDLNEMA